MAHFLQEVRFQAGWLSVAALLCFASSASAAPFSHKLHLQMKLTCVTCHAAAANSTKVADNNLPSAAVCATCHKDQIPPIKQQPSATNLAHFNHQQHVKFGNTIAPAIAKAIDSGAYLSPPGDLRRHLDNYNTANASCTGCHRGLQESEQVTHAAFPQMADCLVCHTKIEAPFTCDTCHAAGANLKPANHTPDYLDRHTNGVTDKPSCAVCHGRRFTCLGCHQGG